MAQAAQCLFTHHGGPNKHHRCVWIHCPCPLEQRAEYNDNPRERVPLRPRGQLPRGWTEGALEKLMWPGVVVASEDGGRWSRSRVLPMQSKTWGHTW